MPQNIGPERLADLLVDIREDLDLEIKNWLELQNNNDAKATFAKAALALANHGGGYIVLGMTETEGRVVEAENRPATLDCYSQDNINGIIQNYCDPHFHCAVHLVSDANGSLFPVAVIPGGHRVPIRARRAGPNGNIVQNHAIYIRKPGPRSEVPQSSQDWDGLLARCLRNRRDELLNHIRDLIAGVVPQAQQKPVEPARLETWIDTCIRRWHALIEPLPQQAGARLPHGSYSLAYEIVGDPRGITLAQLPETLRASVVRHTGWPPFWYPTRNGIEPYPIDGVVECWLGGDPQTPVEDRDAAHSDFWRISPEGLAFLLRGFQEDDLDPQTLGRPVPAATIFDVVLPVWRVGETFLQAKRLADNLFEEGATLKFVATYNGLAGRALASVDRRRNIRGGRVAHQGSIRLETHVEAHTIDANLPEILHPFLSPLYELFDFFELPMQLVVDELTRMRA